MTEAEHKAIEGRALLLYDGVCALCNSSVRFIMKHDRPDQFRYAPLDSELGREMLARFNIHAFPNGVVLVTQTLQPGERIYLRSDAVAESLRDWGYGVVAHFRYRLFGRYDTCPLPSPEQRSRLLGIR